nr:long-chain fatty acid--CoA ligase [Candidatus Njordarchaeota archaeon]
MPASTKKNMSYDARPWQASYDKHVPQSLEPYDKKRLLFEVLDDAAAKFPDRDALIFKRRIAFREFNELSERFATALAALGVRPGDTVGNQLANIPQFQIALYGILKAGATAMGVSPLLKERDLIHQISDSGAKAIVTLDSTLPLVNNVRGKLERLKQIIVTSPMDFSPGERPPPQEVPGALQFLNLLTKYKANPPKVKGAIDPVTTPALLQYTGGTTGVPKGAMLTHYSMFSNLKQMSTWMKLEEGKHVGITAFPFFHQAGLALSILSVYVAGTQILLPNPRDIRTMFQLLREYKPDITANVPTLYQMIAQHPEAKKEDLSCLKICVSGAAPFPPEAIREFEKSTGATVLEVYGMTEACPIVTMNPRYGQRKIGSVGMPMPDTDVRIVDLETGTKVLPQGEAGEIISRGPQIMKGYWNKPEETAQVLRDGWFHTGDVGRMDEDGYFYIVDRTKDMINVSGFKVYPREVDDVLTEHPAVALAAVVGIPNPERPGSEIVKAFIVLKTGQQGSDRLAEDIKSFVKDRLAPYKVPKTIEFKKELPLSLVGKVLKRELRTTVR